MTFIIISEQLHGGIYVIFVYNGANGEKEKKKGRKDERKNERKEKRRKERKQEGKHEG